MDVIDNNAKLDIECPKCKGQFTKTIRELKQSDVKCPKCGVSFETSDFKKGLDKVERELKDLKRKIGNMKF